MESWWRRQPSNYPGAAVLAVAVAAGDGLIVGFLKSALEGVWLAVVTFPVAALLFAWDVRQAKRGKSRRRSSAHPAWSPPPGRPD